MNLEMINKIYLERFTSLMEKHKEKVEENKANSE
jgi:hypothetical protein